MSSENIDKMTIEKLQAVAKEANKIILNALCVMGLKDEEHIKDVLLKGSRKKRVAILQEMITQLLLRLDNVPVNPTTRIMRKIQVRHLLRTGKALESVKFDDE